MRAKLRKAAKCRSLGCRCEGCARFDFCREQEQANENDLALKLAAEKAAKEKAEAEAKAAAEKEAKEKAEELLNKFFDDFTIANHIKKYKIKFQNTLF